MIYLDTSAFIKLYFLEDGSEYVQRCVMEQNHPLPFWEIQEMELINACHLKVFWGDISAAEADVQIQRMASRLHRGQYYVPEINRGALMNAFRNLSRQTPQFGCRSMDILHVACALQISPRFFISYDRRQRELADHAGLTVRPDTLH